MPDIYHDFPVSASAEAVFKAATQPEGLDAWWTKRSSGQPGPGAEYVFWFGPQHDWRGKVRTFDPGREVEWELTRADPDWQGTRVGISLTQKGSQTWVRFHHTGWPEDNQHYRISSYCWAMYLRLMRRYVELGEVVPYEKRLDA